MIDMYKAVNAAMEVKASQRARMSFASFLVRTSNPTIDIAQWRTIGAEAAVMSAFLDAAGFSQSDYTMYVSRLDPSIVDFRWSPSGRISELMRTLSEHAGSVTKMLSTLASGDIPSWPERPGAEVEAVTVPFPFRVEDVTAQRIAALGELCTALVNGEAVDGVEFSGGKFNGVWSNVVERISAMACVESATNVAVADPWIVEAAARLLPEFAGSRPGTMPENAVFGPPADRAGGMSLIRYLRPGEKVPGLGAMLSAIPAYDYCTVDPEDNLSPLVGYFARTKEDAARLDLLGKGTAIVLTSCSINTWDRPRALSFAATGAPFWKYVRDIYGMFYGGVNVGICPYSRIGVGSSGRQFVSEYFQCNSELERVYGADDTTVVAGIALTTRPVSNSWDPDGDTEYKEIKISDYGQVPDESPYAEQHMTRAEIPALWFSAIHCHGSDIGGYNEYRYYTSEHSERSRLARFRRKYSAPSKRTVAAKSTYGLSQDLEPEYSRYGGVCYKAPAALMSGIASIVRRYSPAAIDGPVRHQDTEAHPATALVSNVYTTEGNAPHGATASEFEKFRDEVAEGQLTRRTDPEDPFLTFIMETNAPFFSGGETFATAVRNLTWNILVCGARSPECYEGHNSARSQSGTEYFRDMATRDGSRLEHIVDTSLVGVGSSSIGQSDIHVETVSDTLGRLNVVVTLSPRIGQYVLAVYRYHIGISLPMAATMVRHASPEALCQLPYPDGWNDDNLYNAVMKRILSSRSSVLSAWGSSTCGLCRYVGPIVTWYHPRSTRSPDRRFYMDHPGGSTSVSEADMTGISAPF